MPEIRLVGDYVKERFVITPQPGRKGWTERTVVLDRPGLVFQTRSLLTACYPEVKKGSSYLPRFVPECPYHSGSPKANESTFYWQMFEVDPRSRLAIRILERRLLRREKPWSITGQLSKLKRSQLPGKCVLFVEQEEYNNQSRQDETHKVFAFAVKKRMRLFIKTNQPHLALEIARKAKHPKLVLVMTTLRALDGDSLVSHTWDGVVRHVLTKLGRVPKWLRVGVELWNEGCIWINGRQGHLFWDMDSPLGAQRLSERGWLPGMTNVTCASLLSCADEDGWPTAQHVKNSWVLSRQCGLVQLPASDRIVDLPEQLIWLLKQDRRTRPHAERFGAAQFTCPLPKRWSFLSGLHVDAALLDSVIKNGSLTLHSVNCPFLSIGALFEIEETKIEQLLTLNHLIRDYASRQVAPRPLSVAVFGPPGAGKSFAIKELAKHADLQPSPEFLSYNLSQLHSVDDIQAAFHAVQSNVSRGRLPFVFWDEFDAEVNGRELGWLNHFLVPMQDGEFCVHGVAHPLGRCVFVFAGSTAHTFKRFAGRNDACSKHAKLPDFVSRIKAWLDVPPLPSGARSAGKLLRAMVAHALIQRHAPHVINTIDADVVEALLSDKYKTIRELEREVETAVLSDTNRFRYARLPHRATPERRS